METPAGLRDQFVVFVWKWDMRCPLSDSLLSPPVYPFTWPHIPLWHFESWEKTLKCHCSITFFNDTDEFITYWHVYNLKSPCNWAYWQTMLINVGVSSWCHKKCERGSNCTGTLLSTINRDSTRISADRYEIYKLYIWTIEILHVFLLLIFALKK